MRNREDPDLVRVLHDDPCANRSGRFRVSGQTRSPDHPLQTRRRLRRDHAPHLKVPGEAPWHGNRRQERIRRRRQHRMDRGEPSQAGRLYHHPAYQRDVGKEGDRREQSQRRRFRTGRQRRIRCTDRIGQRRRSIQVLGGLQVRRIVETRSNWLGNGCRDSGPVCRRPSGTGHEDRPQACQRRWWRAKEGCGIGEVMSMP